MADPFWDSIDEVLQHARDATTAKALIDAVRQGPDQDAGDPAGQAFFAGSGGEVQLVDALTDPGHWTVTWIDGEWHWKAADSRGSIVEYIEGDLYLR